MSRKPREDRSSTPGFGATFGALLAAQGLAPAAPASVDPTPSPATPSEAPLRAEGKVHLRISRKGRGGKTVTEVEGLAEPERWAAVFKTALGVGATVEEALVIVQGDQLARLKTLLVGRGVKV